MGVIQTNGKEIMAAVSGDHLLIWAVTKLIREGTPYQDIGKKAETLARDINNMILSGLL